MSTQYDTIQAPYDEMRTRSIALLEHADVQSAVAPFIKDARILELACGSAFYSYDLLRWGASKVIGIDISTAMVEKARDAAGARQIRDSSTIEFRVADCSKPMSFEGGPFDLVFAAWLLNYASSSGELVEMFRNGALNLKEGGHFVSVCPPPRQEPAAYYKEERDIRPERSGGLLSEVTKDVGDGVLFHVYCSTEHGDMNFDNYHLTKRIYEASAREAGFRGEIQWSVTTVPDVFFKDRSGGASIEELESYKVTPHYGLIVVAK